MAPHPEDGALTLMSDAFYKRRQASSVKTREAVQPFKPLVSDGLFWPGPTRLPIGHWERWDY